MSTEKGQGSFKNGRPTNPAYESFKKFLNRGSIVPFEMVEKVFNPIICPSTGYVYSSRLDQFERWAYTEVFELKKNDEKQTYEVL